MVEVPLVVVRQCDTYPEAQRVVDFLADAEFPVTAMQIVGSDLRMVETVTGRLTYGRAAAAGLATGAWFGMLVGLIVAMFGNGDGDPSWTGMVVWGIAWGGAFGIVYGLIAHAATRGRRDFTSRSTITATHYDVSCPAGHAEQARILLATMPAA